jgi:hypothetical protein
MSFCPAKHFIPDNNLACPTCVQEQAAAAFHDLQVQFLRKVARREFNYFLRVTQGRDKHAMMYGATTHTFCGKKLPRRPKLDDKPYYEIEDICAGCRIAILAIMPEAAW